MSLCFSPVAILSVIYSLWRELILRKRSFVFQKVTCERYRDQAFGVLIDSVAVAIAATVTASYHLVDPKAFTAPCYVRTCDLPS